MKTLVIVESPNKCASIKKYLGIGYTVMASVGHIRDLKKDSSGIDIENEFKPNWENTPEKKDIIVGLKKAYKESDDIIVMTDGDSEGSAIGWHICEVLGIDPKKVKRSITYEITQKGVKEAIDKPGKLDMNIVDAAIGRRLLDRIFGFKLSAVLWDKVKMGLSGGRVQSPALRLLCTVEKQHREFTAEALYKVVGIFETKDENNKIHSFNAVLNKKFNTKQEAENFLKKLVDKNCKVKSIEKKAGKKAPSPPFITSSVQMEASRKLGMSPQRCMETLQNLFSNGHITYHRSDSTTLSEDALNAAESIVIEKFGKKYSNKKQYITKNKSAESAHEAIRPTHFENESINGSVDEQKIYTLVYSRTLASQMQPALVDNTIVTISINGTTEEFIGKGTVVTFDGFLKLYSESVEDKETDEEDESKILPDMKTNQLVNHIKVVAGQVYNKPSARYSEASLIKELESLKIGRPSTYASIISTLQKRLYCERKDLPSKKRDVITLTLQNKKINEEIRAENYGGDKNKLIPTDTGMIVNDFLCNNFPNLVNYDFTANMEKSLDLIAEGKLNRVKMLKEFYGPFMESIKLVTGSNTGKAGVRELGIDPKTNLPVCARLGKFGPMVQLGESVKKEKGKEKGKEKEKSDIKFASIPKEKSIDTITLEEALDLLKWPRLIGEHKGKEVIANNGRFGPFVKYNDKFYSITLAPEDISLEEALEIIKIKDEGGGGSKAIKEYGDIKILSGQYGPYISCKKKNYKIPAHMNPETMTEKECKELIDGIKANPPVKKKAWGGKKKK